MFRHLPPTATPLPWNKLPRALWAADEPVEQFRAALARYLNVRSCFLASSGRTALYLLLHSLRRPSEQATPIPTVWGGLPSATKAGRYEVVLPAYTCPSLAKVILDAGLVPRLVDISPSTLAFDPAQLSAAVGEKTLAVILVHPFGIPQPLGDIQRLAHSAGAMVIEDAAQSMGARIGDRYAGTLGDYGLFSFGPGKPLSTGGGGLVCTNDAESAGMLAAAWEGLPANSGLASTWAAVRLALFTTAFHPTGWWFATKAGAHRVGDNEASWGYTLRGLTDAQAAIGQMLLPRLNAVNEQRREHAQQLAMALQGLKHSLLPGPGLLSNASGGQPVAAAPRRVTPHHAAPLTSSGVTKDVTESEVAELQPIFLRLPLITAYHAMRERLVEALWKEGISAGRMYRRRLDEYFPQLGGGAYPGAEHVARCLLTLPTHHYLDTNDVKRIAQIVHTVDSA